MPIDFTQIESGEEFELLCENLLQAMGFPTICSEDRTRAACRVRVSPKSLYGNGGLRVKMAAPPYAGITEC